MKMRRGSMTTARPVAVVTFASCSTTAADAGAVLPSIVLPPVPQLVTTSRRIDQTAANSEWNTAVGVIDELRGFLRGKVVLTTVAPDISRSCLELFVSRLSSTFLVNSLCPGVMVVSKALAASIGVGRDEVRVLDFGLEAFTASFVVGGVTEDCAVSRTLGLGKVLTSSTTSVSCGDIPPTQLDTTRWERVRALLGGPSHAGASFDLSKSPLHRLLRQLSRESKSAPVLITGEALDRCVGLFAALRVWLLQTHIVPMHAHLATDASASIFDAIHDQPALAHFTGASLLASMCREECERLLITRSDLESREGASVVHSRCPGLAPDDEAVKGP